ncbi:MAG TPA: response regulator, partial [Thermopetrobacter sp.]|nr:response regulator [Thermopetrobacter sp.]
MSPSPSRCPTSSMWWPPSSRPGTGSDRTMSARILVVDDVPANVRLLQDKLEREYYEVFTANGGREALEKVRRVKPDIVLLDVMMPDINGIEVCHRMKADPALAHIPIIMITALDAPEDRLRGLKAGADDFLSKPINDTDLFVRIRALLRRKMLVDELLAGSGEGADDTLERLLPLVDDQQPARISLIDDGDLLRPRIEQALRGRHQVAVVAPQAVANLEAGGCCDLIVLNLDLHSADGLRICALLRS